MLLGIIAKWEHECYCNVKNFEVSHSMPNDAKTFWDHMRSYASPDDFFINGFNMINLAGTKTGGPLLWHQEFGCIKRNFDYVCLESKGVISCARAKFVFRIKGKRVTFSTCDCEQVNGFYGLVEVDVCNEVLREAIENGFTGLMDKLVEPDAKVNYHYPT